MSNWPNIIAPVHCSFSQAERAQRTEGGKGKGSEECMLRLPWPASLWLGAPEGGRRRQLLMGRQDFWSSHILWIRLTRRLYSCLRTPSFLHKWAANGENGLWRISRKGC